MTTENDDQMGVDKAEVRDMTVVTIQQEETGSYVLALTHQEIQETILAEIRRCLNKVILETHLDEDDLHP